MSFEKLIYLRDKIENLDKIHHIEILRILKNNNIAFTENRNGIFVNMILCNNNTILQIETFLNFIENQNKHLDDIEKTKDEFMTKYFKKGNKDKNIKLFNVP